MVSKVKKTRDKKDVLKKKNIFEFAEKVFSFWEAKPIFQQCYLQEWVSLETLQLSLGLSAICVQARIDEKFTYDFTYETRISYVKWKISYMKLEFHIWNQNFTYEL